MCLVLTNGKNLLRLVKMVKMNKLKAKLLIIRLNKS
jgi:hypothetical protein